MNLATLIVIAVLALAVGAALWSIHRRRRSGKNPYCSGCALSSVCGKKSDGRPPMREESKQEKIEK